MRISQERNEERKVSVNQIGENTGIDTWEVPMKLNKGQVVPSQVP